MSFKCNTVSRLTDLARNTNDPHLAGAAKHALVIIQDLQHSVLSRVDLECLESLVDAIHQDGSTEILGHLDNDAPDCQICAALSLQMQEIEKGQKSGAQGS